MTDQQQLIAIRQFQDRDDPEVIVTATLYALQVAPANDTWECRFEITELSKPSPSH